MIKGVTHAQDGRALQRLSVSTKVAIGLPPDKDHNHPTKLDHFVLLRKAKVAKGVEWELDPDLMKHYGENCRELGIVLLDDDLENVFPTCYAWWTATERRCWGDGENATRRTQQTPSGEPWLPCGPECDDLKEGRCKPSGDLRFVLQSFPRLGSICRIHTSSYRSVRQIHSALQEIQQFTGGRLAGLTASLIVRPEEGIYRDKDGKKKSTTIWALSLEVHGPDMKKLMGNLTENAQVFINARKLLGGHVLEVVEDETEQGTEVTKEFYPPEPAPAPAVTMPRRASEAVKAEDRPQESIPDAEVDEGPTDDQQQEPPPEDKGKHESNGKITVPEREEIFKLAKTVGFTDKKSIGLFIFDKFGIAETKDITSEMYPKVLKAVTEWKATPSSEEEKQEVYPAAEVKEPPAKTRKKKDDPKPVEKKPDPKISESDQKEVLQMARTYLWMKGSGNPHDALHIFLAQKVQCLTVADIPEMALALVKKTLKDGPVAMGLEVAK